MNNARVFISCGQGKDEKETGLKIYDKFKEKYRPYFAENIRDPEGGFENIFKALRKSEYYIGIDFKRDKYYCGSLFVQQELAIAAFLKLKIRFFQEEDIKEEGILKHSMIHPIRFKNEEDLIKKIEYETKDWTQDWTNELILKKGETHKDFETNNNDKIRADWYHIEVYNNNKFDYARNCIGYISKIIRLYDKKQYELPTLELIWAGLGHYSANIIQKTPREIDAFYIIRGDNQISFHTRKVYSTTPKYNYPKLGAGEYIIEYTILSDNFEKAQKEFYLNFGGDYECIEFIEIY